MLSPAEWIWLPSERTLPNTVVTFAKIVTVGMPITTAKGWICADSRYRLTVNGQRVQWGPAPCDPRWPEADPIDLAPYLQPGENQIEVDVLYYGSGDGTWAMGKPGLIMRLDISDSGDDQQVVTDDSWLCRVNRCYSPGAPRRWFLRAFQETYDPRNDGGDWHQAMVLNVPSHKPAFLSSYNDYSLESGLIPSEAYEVRKRSIPLLREERIEGKLVATGGVNWSEDPANWFDFRIPILTGVMNDPSPETVLSIETVTGLTATHALFEFDEQIVGWPYFEIVAPEGMIVEIITSEAHDRQRRSWLDSGFYSWSRYICHEGVNSHGTFDFESLRWMQLHFHGVEGWVEIISAGVRRRVFPWLHDPKLQTSDKPLQKLFDANLNTLNNCAQETCVDGMARERQQYSGDGSHQLHAIRYAFGAYDLSARFLKTFSQGITPEGYFLDCWPGFDRLARVMEKQIGASYWGPLLDHGVGFVFDCWNHYWETGSKADLEEPYPRLLRFAHYLENLIGKDGLLPVEGMPLTNVYMDHQAYHEQREKQCAFNLYVSAMFKHALAPLQELFGDDISTSVEISDALLTATISRFWSDEHGAFVNNLPWIDDQPHFDDRSLATSILFDQMPAQSHNHERLLADLSGVGLSYPANAVWRHWALGKLGRIDVVLNDLRRRWATMDSVRLNNTIQEFWTVRTDSTDLWSHCAVAPLTSLFMDIVGLRPAAPGFEKFVLRPQLGDLQRLSLTAQTPHGPVHFESEQHLCRLRFPSAIRGEVVLKDGTTRNCVSGEQFRI